MRLLSCLLKTPQWPQRVLAITKLCVFELLKELHPELWNNQTLNQTLKSLSKEYREIIDEYQRQIAWERHFMWVLRNLNVNYRIVKKMEDAKKYLNWADLIIIIGGDNDFVLAAKLVMNNKIPICGINPHPSTDETLSLPMEYSVDIDRIFEKLRAGNYKVLMRSRICTIMTGIGLYQRPIYAHERQRTRHIIEIDPYAKFTLENEKYFKTSRRILPWLVLNEVYMSEVLPAKSIRLEIQTNSDKAYTMNSSGMCICTGSGFQCWYKDSNSPRAENIRGLISMATGREFSWKEINEVLYKYYRRLSFSPEDARMAYIILELYCNVRDPIIFPERQMCYTIKVRSYGYDANLLLDKYISMPFNDGSTALFEIRPEYSLKNIILQ